MRPCSRFVAANKRDPRDQGAVAEVAPGITRRSFVRGLFAGIAAVAVATRLAPEIPKLQDPRLPPGWSVTHDRRGEYTIRHNFAIKAQWTEVLGEELRETFRVHYEGYVP